MTGPGRRDLVPLLLVLALVWACLFSQGAGLGLGSLTKEVDLGGTWQVHNANGSVKLTGQVPGTIHTDLQRAGIISDPYYRYNDVAYRWIGLDDWTYTRQFELSSAVLNQKEILLVCEGIDTAATISINGKQVAQVDNMFRRYLIHLPRHILNSVDKTTQISTNTISISFTSAETYAATKAKQTPYELPSADDLQQQHGERFRNFIRKEQCSFSWDWGPCFMPQGIWRPIKIVAFSFPIITAFTTQTFPVGKPGTTAFRIHVETTLRSPGPSSGTLYVSAATIGQKQDVQLKAGDNRIRFVIDIQNVQLWWPIGYGSHPLYDVSVAFIDSTHQYAVNDSTRIGFRSVELVTDNYKNQNGSSMYFRINGVPIFAKGANFVPLDSFEEKVTSARLLNLIESSLEVNMNIIRVWGGGIYQHEEFYRLCDERGMMVWQEFMFACAMYPRDHLFLATVTEEVTYQVERLMNHPSIILWSGSNENEAALDWFPATLNNPRLYVADYAQLYFNTIHTKLRTIDQSRPFWPSSPSNGIIEENPFVAKWGNPYSTFEGDLHYYNYAPDCTDVSTYPSPRFASEYGYQSYPSLYTWQKVVNEAAGDLRSPYSPLMLHRQHHSGGTNQVVAQVQNYFRYSNKTSTEEGFEHFVYLTQCTQALCIKSESEHYRRSKSETANTMGAIYWQLNDIWQAPTWSSLEYGGRWKILHYFVRNFFAPVLVSAYEQPKDALHVHVTSDMTTGISGKVTLALWKWTTGRQVASWEATFSLPALGSAQVYSGSIARLLSGHCGGRNECVLILTATDPQNRVLASNNFYLSSFAQVDLPEPHIAVSVTSGSRKNEAVVSVKSQALAPYTFLQSPVSGRFSDNAFLLLPNTTRQVTFFGWEDFSLNQFQSTLRVMSIRDTY
jgi:beta-mannosidase